jgi:hypothetical protein
MIMATKLALSLAAAKSMAIAPPEFFVGAARVGSRWDSGSGGA